MSSSLVIGKKSREQPVLERNCKPLSTPTVGITGLLILYNRFSFWIQRTKRVASPCDSCAAACLVSSSITSEFPIKIGAFVWI
jgi:hypothetical protein